MRHRRTQVLLGLIILGCTLLAGGGSAMAADDTPQQVPPSVCPICGRANQESGSYAAKASYTLARGASNTLLGWTEVIHKPANEARQGGNVLTGIAKGVGRGVARTALGIGELLTFWTPKINNRYPHLAHDCPLCMGTK